jgi:hypothetical protein
MTVTSLRSFSDFVSVAVNILRDQLQSVMNYEADSIEYYECVCILALVSRRANRILVHRITLFSVSCLGLPYFSTISHKWHDFWKKVIEHKLRFLILSTTFV